MKKIIVVLLLIASGARVNAQMAGQISKAAQIKPANKPVDNPYQVPNYYQNNSMYNNNSLQNNQPSMPSSFPGNGNYIDPTRNPVNIYNWSNTTQGPVPGPVSPINNTSPKTTAPPR